MNNLLQYRKINQNNQNNLWKKKQNLLNNQFNLIARINKNNRINKYKFILINNLINKKENIFLMNNILN